MMDDERDVISLADHPYDKDRRLSFLVTLVIESCIEA